VADIFQHFVLVFSLGRERKRKREGVPNYQPGAAEIRQNRDGLIDKPAVTLYPVIWTNLLLLFNSENIL
jgi:hypothetical protein